MTSISTLGNSLISKLRTSRSIIITSHVKPDGDAIGSCLGLYHWAVSEGLNARIVLVSPVPYNLRWLPSSDTIELYQAQVHDVVIGTADSIVVLDLNSLGRLADMGESIRKSESWKAIVDHHIDPEDFANCVIADVDATSTCEMVYEILKQEKCAVGMECATALYTGIMTDTGNFRFPRTDSAVHRSVAELIEFGADPVSAYENVMNQNSVARTLLYGESLAGLEFECNGEFCAMTVTREQMARLQVSDDELDGFVQVTLSIEGVRLGILFVEIADAVKLSFRSKAPIDVNLLARHFNGGGHQFAAGGKVSGKTLEEVKRDVVAKSIEFLRGTEL